MVNAARTAMAGLAMVMVLAAATETHAAGRVRVEDPGLAALIAETARRSATFRQMIEAIDASDGLVFVERGRCGHGVRACLSFLMTVAGPNRFLRIVLDDRNTDAEAMGSLGHELRHVLELLAEPTVTSAATMHLFYHGKAMRTGDGFETKAAIIAGDAVRAELRQAESTGGTR
jgi:hypothetical protein